MITCMVGLYFYYLQLTEGLTVTHLSDQVSWGVYIANFTFLVGVAGASVLLIFPVYFMNHRELKAVLLGGILISISAIIMSLLFIVVDLGRPDRFIHMLPYFGKLNFPKSVLAWDVIAINGYLLINLHVPGYILYQKYRGKKPESKFYVPMILLSIFWALALHTVTAFLYLGLGGRPYWNSAILAPRFLVSEFAGAPAIIILAFYALKHYAGMMVHENVFEFLKKIMMIFIPINLFLFFSEMFKEFYTDNAHSVSAKYLFFGIHGQGILRPYIWAGLIMSLLALFIILIPKLRNHKPSLIIGCIFTILGIWVEKGMGLIIPGFIPTPLGDLVEYSPSIHEFFISLGIWSFGILVFSMMSKVVIAIYKGELHE